VCVSEVYLDTVNTDKTWIEFYNPSDKDITVDGGRYSHIKTKNHLPSFTVSSKSHFVLCANKSVFISNYGEIDNLLEESTLGLLSEFGGFFAFYTNKDSTKISDAFRYGELNEYNNEDWLESSALIPFLHSDSSCTLKIHGKNEHCNLYDYKITSPTPGY